MSLSRIYFTQGGMDHSEEKSFDPSAKRLKEARLQGDLPYSEALFKVTFLLLALGALWLFAPHLGKAFHTLFTTSFSGLHRQNLMEAFPKAFSPVLKPVLLLMTLFFFVTLLFPTLQRGFLWAFKKKKGESSPRTIPLLFLVAQGVVIALFTLLYVWWGKLSFSSLLFFPLFLLGALFLLACGDYFYQRYAWQKRMRMTKAEMQEERRESEGNR